MEFALNRRIAADDSCPIRQGSFCATARAPATKRRLFLIPDWLIQVLAVLEVLVTAPLLKGVIDRWKAYVQSRRGPPYLQPYYNLHKHFRKDMVVSRNASWLFHLVPLVYFVVPLVFATLIPVLSAYPLPL